MPASASKSRCRVILNSPFSACAVIGEIEALIEKRIDIRRSVLSGAFSRVQQHVLDDRVGALTVLDDFWRLSLIIPVNSLPLASCYRAGRVLAGHSVRLSALPLAQRSY